MAFRAVSNCLKTGTELVYIGLVMVVSRLGLSGDVYSNGRNPNRHYRARPNGTRGSPSKWQCCMYRSRSLPQPGNGSFRNVQSGRLPTVGPIIALQTAGFRPKCLYSPRSTT